jgi:hypothetical protein
MKRYADPELKALTKLDARRWKWVKFHSTNIAAAFIAATALQEDVSRAATHTLCLTITPRQEHAGSPGQFFELRSACVVTVSEVSLFSEQRKQHWEECLQVVRSKCERLNKRLAVVAIETNPLPDFFWDFEVVNVQAIRNPADWQTFLMEAIRDGFGPV